MHTNRRTLQLQLQLESICSVQGKTDHICGRECTSALVPEAWVRTILVKPLSFSVISTEPGISAICTLRDLTFTEQPSSNNFQPRFVQKAQQYALIHLPLKEADLE